MLLVFFFFSSRRRHTRLQGDWSSDVCSSDLLFRHWLETEGAKGWDALDTAPDSGYEKVWRAWLRSLGDVGMSAKEDPPPPPPPQSQSQGEAPPPGSGEHNH